MAKHQAAEQESLGEAMNKTELFLENNGRKLSYIFLGLLILGGLIYGYRALVVSPRCEKAAEMIYQAQARFDAQTPDYELALTGDANGVGFLEVIEQYGSTPSGNLAKHYAGVCYLHMGDLEKAAEYLADYSAVDGLPGALINAQNLGLQGDVAVQQDNFEKAVKFYKEAVEVADNDMTAPLYLRKAALAAKAAGDVEQARSFLERILASYPASNEARDAEKLMGGLN